MVFLNLLTALFIKSVVPQVRSSGICNMISLEGHVTQYLPPFVFNHPIQSVFIPFLSSAQVIIIITIIIIIIIMTIIIIIIITIIIVVVVVSKVL